MFSDDGAYAGKFDDQEEKLFSIFREEGGSKSKRQFNYFRLLDREQII